MKSMAKMAASMRPQMEAMKAAQASGSSSGSGGGGSSSGGGEVAAPPGMPDMANMDIDKGLEMMKNMDPAMMKSMSKMMGRDIDEKQMEQVQKMMADMSPETMQKWAGRAQAVAGFAKKPVAAYRSCKAFAAQLGALGALGILGAILGMLMLGHVTDTF